LCFSEDKAFNLDETYSEQSWQLSCDKTRKSSARSLGFHYAVIVYTSTLLLLLLLVVVVVVVVAVVAVVIVVTLMSEEGKLSQILYYFQFIIVRCLTDLFKYSFISCVFHTCYVYCPLLFVSACCVRFCCGAFGKRLSTEQEQK